MALAGPEGRRELARRHFVLSSAGRRNETRQDRPANVDRLAEELSRTDPGLTPD
jgi:hypothetical protein